MLDAIERPLTASEREHLITRLHAARAESRTALIKTGAASAAVCVPLMLLTFWLSDAPRLVIAGFWIVMSVVFTMWIGVPWRRLMRGQIPVLEDAMHTNRVRELRLRSDRVVEFEEEEDEGACYAFDYERGVSTIFVIGQEFYEDDDFPNSDFSMIEILGRSGGPVDVLLTKRGRTLTPDRVVPARVKNQIELPQHLEIIQAPLERIESTLSNRSVRV